MTLPLLGIGQVHRDWRASPAAGIASGAATLLIVAYTLGFVGLPLRFTVADIQTSGLELAAGLALLSLFVVDGGQLPRAARIGYAILLLSALPATVIGAAQNDLSRVLRDLSQLTYISAMFVGMHIVRSCRLDIDRYLVALVYAISLLSIAYIVDHHTGINLVSDRYQYTMRIVASLAVILILSRFAGLQQLRDASVFVLIFCLVALLAYTLENRTRATLLMQAVGILVLLVGSLTSPVTRRQRSRAIIVVGVFVYAIAIAWLTTLVLSDLTGHELEVIPSGGSLGRTSDLLTSGIDPTARYRFEAWDAAVSPNREDWIMGTGMGAYLTLDPLLRGQPEPLPAAMIHNTPLQIFYSGGVVHLLGFGIFFISLFRYAGNPTSPLLRGRRNALLGFVAGYLAYSVFSVAFFDITAAVFFWFTLGLLVESLRPAAPTAPNAPKRNANTRPSPRLRPLK